MSTLMNQLEHVMRRLWRAPLFTVITLVTIAIGIGANTAIFSVINGILLKPLPYPDPDRLVGVWQTAPGIGIADLNASPATYYTYREEGRVFEESGIWQGDSVSITGLAEPEHVEAVDVTDGLLPALGVKPLIGRWFSRGDDVPGSPGTVLLSYGYWKQRFGGDTGVLGKRIVADGQAREVIGVMPREFRFMNRKPAIILPLQLDRNKVFIGNFSFQGIARLKPGMTVAQANSDVARMLPMLARKFNPPPGMNLKMLEEARLGPSVRPLRNDVVGDIGKVLWVLMGAIGTVLFIACANVANLMLVRAEGRQQELAIRAALGAGWARIARELLFESMTLGLIGGALGLGLAYAALRLLVSIAPAGMPRLEEISIDPLVLSFTFAIALLAGALFGLIPVFKYAGGSLGATLREGGRALSEGRERHRARGMLVVVQVALALVLLIGSGLMLRTFQAIRQVQPGFTQPEQIQTLRISIADTQVRDEERVTRIENDIMDKLAAIPGVSSVGASNSITMDGSNDNDPVFAEGRNESESRIPPLRRFKFISPGYFKTMGNRLLAGRDFTWTDIYGKRAVVLITENFAREYWGSPSAAIGKRVHETPKAAWREIVGVVGDELDDGANKKAPTVIYWPLMRTDFWGQKLVSQRNLAFALRTNRAASASLLEQARQAVWSVDPNLPLADVRTVQEIFEKSMARTSFTLVMLALAAGMALLLGVVGIYGVISYSVSQKTREIGIRIALGAPQQEVQKMFVRHGLFLTGIGVACGLTAAFALTRLMTSLLFDVSPVDPITYLLVPVGLVAAATLASYFPARRATNVEPIEALRVE